MSIPRSLRQRQTTMEVKLWKRLRNRYFHGYKFRRQHPIGRFIVDFVCLEEKLILELDGALHILKKREDDARDAYLEEQGFCVLRIRNSEMKESFDWCLQKIRAALERDV